MCVRRGRLPRTLSAARGAYNRRSAGVRTRDEMRRGRSPLAASHVRSLTGLRNRKRPPHARLADHSLGFVSSLGVSAGAVGSAAEFGTAPSSGSGNRRSRAQAARPLRPTGQRRPPARAATAGANAATSVPALPCTRITTSTDSSSDPAAGVVAGAGAVLGFRSCSATPAAKPSFFAASRPRDATCSLGRRLERLRRLLAAGGTARFGRPAHPGAGRRRRDRQVGRSRSSCCAPPPRATPGGRRSPAAHRRAPPARWPGRTRPTACTRRR